MGIFHEGEIAVQRKFGVRQEAESLAGMVQPLIKSGRDRFISDRNEAFVASVDKTGSVWASVVFGAAGFVHSTESRSSVIIERGIHPLDPLTENSSVDGSHLGFLFIDLSSRSRIRVNGISSTKKATKGGLYMSVLESFGNCPKYITTRTPEVDSSLKDAVRTEMSPRTNPDAWKGLRMQDRLSDSHLKLISASDFFTIATLRGESKTGRKVGGADMSHRGGRPGFVRAHSDVELYFPDYRGNNLYNTLGNIFTNPSTGLLFIDWSTGSTLQLTGESTILFPDDLVRMSLWDQFEACKCVVRFRVRKVLETPQAVPWRYKRLELSPYSPALVDTPKSRISKGDKEQKSLFPVPAKLVEVRNVATGVKDFRFEVGGSAKVKYVPGQFAAFNLDIPVKDGSSGGKTITNRSWTISSAPNVDRTAGFEGNSSFHITVKHKVGGLASTWLHQNLRVGQTVELTGVDGSFSCFVDSKGVPKGSLLFLSAGIGITPLLSMLRGLQKLPESAFSERVDVVFLHSARTLEDIPFLTELSQSLTGHKMLSVRYVVNLAQQQAIASDLGEKFVLFHGRFSEPILLSAVPDVSQRRVYMCGPDGYMSLAEKILEKSGVHDVNKEEFYF